VGILLSKNGVIVVHLSWKLN